MSKQKNTRLFKSKFPLWGTGGFLLLLLLPFASISQELNLEDVKGQLKKRFSGKAVKVSGGFALNNVFQYNGGAAASNPQPYTYIASGNINFNIYGYNMPFTFTYSNQKFGYTNPSFKFNRFALHPRYKKWVGHIGDVSMSFSPYTLSGFQFTGGGVEYNGSTFQVQALYGRFLKAVKEDTLVVPSYKRMGYGLKTTYGTGSKKIAMSLFHAGDKEQSIASPVKPENMNIKPMQGTAIAFEGSYPVIAGLVVQAEFSTSVLTKDLRQNNDSAKNTSSFLKNLVSRPNSTTSIYHALRAGINYSFSQTALGINYERVDPDYQTLGGYFFTNDFENIMLTIAQNFWQSKANVNISTGLQRDDLSNIKQSNMKRLALSLGGNLRPNDKLNIGVNYSNLQSFTFLRDGFEQINQVNPYENLDTLDFTQLSQNAGANMSYALQQSKERIQAVTASLNYMESANKKGDIIRKGDVTRFVNMLLNYNISFVPKDLTLAVGFNYSWNRTAMINNTMMGPNVAVSKLFFKKLLRTNYGMSYNTTTGGDKRTNVFNIRAGASAMVKKKHNINTSIVYQQRGGNAAANSYFTATAGYSFSF
jgi:hypothetical protein